MRLTLLTSIWATTAAYGATLNNQPILWEDLADLDVFRVDNVFYYSASTMHYSPGAPILQSYDLINWEYIGHSVPSLDWGSQYSLQGGQSAYSKGVYASSLRRRPSDGQWFWVGCIEYSRSYIYTAPSATGPWAQLAYFPNVCYYDCGLLFDSDMTPYIAYGSMSISVAQMSKDLKSQVSSKVVYTYSVTTEGSRMYKINNSYYILNIDPSTTIEYVIKSSSPFGSYSQAILSNAPASPISVNGVRTGNPHQGGIVDDVDGNWYYMSFCDAYPGGRIPVLAPIQFNSQGFPYLPNNQWPNSVSTPMATKVLRDPQFTDTFSASSLAPEWEWNHNPNTSAFSISNGLTLRTASLTDNLFLAQNTLTHRILGPRSTATITLNYSSMASGDRAGLVMLRDISAWVGIINNGGSKVVGVWSGLNLTQGSSGWSTSSKGSLLTSTSIPSSGTILLRASANVEPSNAAHQVQFAYSTNGGSSFTNISSPFTMTTAWQFFMGYRYGIFNFATQQLGGKVTVSKFEMKSA